MVWDDRGSSRIEMVATVNVAEMTKLQYSGRRGFEMSLQRLVTAATGHVGGRLLSMLQLQNVKVRCGTQRREAQEERYSLTTEVVAVDVLDRETMPSGSVGVDTAYYVLRSMGVHRNFGEQDRTAASHFADAAESLARAPVNEDCEFKATRWSDSLSSGGVRSGSRLVDSRTVVVSVPPEQAFTLIRRIGGRRDEDSLRMADSLDFWRVELDELGRRLRLHAEMRVRVRARLEFEVTPCEQGSTIRQTAIFAPLGLLGILYWYGIYPLHQLVFAGMLLNIAGAAENSGTTGRHSSPEKPSPVVMRPAGVRL
jgi:hypothetical protein